MIEGIILSTMFISMAVGLFIGGTIVLIKYDMPFLFAAGVVVGSASFSFGIMMAVASVLKVGGYT